MIKTLTKTFLFFCAIDCVFGVSPQQAWADPEPIEEFDSESDQETKSLAPISSKLFCHQKRGSWREFTASIKHLSAFALWGERDIAVTYDGGRNWIYRDFDVTNVDQYDLDNEKTKIASASILADGSLLILFHDWRIAKLSPPGDWDYFIASRNLRSPAEPEVTIESLHSTEHSVIAIDSVTRQDDDQPRVYVSKDQGQSWSILSIFSGISYGDNDAYYRHEDLIIHVTSQGNILALDKYIYLACEGPDPLLGIYTDAISPNQKSNADYISADVIGYDGPEKYVLGCADYPYLGHDGSIYLFSDCRDGYDGGDGLYFLQNNGSIEKKLIRVQGLQWPETITDQSDISLRLTDKETFVLINKKLFQLKGHSAEFVMDLSSHVGEDSRVSIDNLERIWIWDNQRINQLDSKGNMQILLDCAAPPSLPTTTDPRTVTPITPPPPPVSNP